MSNFGCQSESGHGHDLCKNIISNKGDCPLKLTYHAHIFFGICSSLHNSELSSSGWSFFSRGDLELIKFSFGNIFLNGSKILLKYFVGCGITKERSCPLCSHNHGGIPIDMIYIKTQVFRLLRYYSPAPRNIARSDWATQNITHNMTSSKT